MATTIEQLKAAKPTWEFKAPPFANGIELIVELRAPSISAMIYGDDGISNPLLNDVQTLTEQAGKKKKNAQPTTTEKASAFRFINKVVSYCMVSPTLAEVNEFAGGLSDTQLLAIYNEALRSTKDLSSFRSESTDN